MARRRYLVAALAWPGTILPWTTNGHRIQRATRSPRNARDCALMYDFEVGVRKLGRGWGDPALVHHPDEGLFRFRDGRFAFSREHADWRLLKKRGRLKGWE